MGTEGHVKRLTHKDGKTRLGTWEAADNQLCILWAKKSKAVITEFSDGDTIK